MKIAFLILFSLIVTGLLALLQKFKRHEPKREFFSKIIGANFYFLYVVYKIDQQIDLYHRWPQAFTLFSWINWSFVMMLFVLFGVSYMIRSTPLAHASRPREILLPLFCAVMPFGINESFEWAKSDIIIHLDILRSFLTPYYRMTPGHWSFSGMTLMLVGNGLTVWAMFHLRGAFSIFTEARKVISRGPYRFVRHPLYVGECLATLGCALYLPSSFNFFIALLFIILIVVRASFEERKLAGVFPEYIHYRSMVGGFIPHLKPSLKKSLKKSIGEINDRT